MLNLAAIALAAASATVTPALTSTAPWWEKMTVTIAADGAQQSCRYESSDPTAANQTCEVDQVAGPERSASFNAGATRTKITFERRFTPGELPEVSRMQAGDTLLGAQVMMLAIDDKGAVRSCHVVAASEEAKPEYGCDEARAERFQASAGQTASDFQVGFLTILVYGHEEQVV